MMARTIAIASHQSLTAICGLLAVMAALQCLPTSDGSIHSRSRLPFATTARQATNVLDGAAAADSVLRTPQPWKFVRGGSTTPSSLLDGGDGGDAGDEEDLDADADADGTILDHPDYAQLKHYRMQQQVLLQLRATILSEAIAKRGIPIPTIYDVQTPAGKAPPDPVDWDCAVSTPEEPKICMYTFDTEVNTKVLAPINTDKWMSVSALNRLRRTDPTKVEAMWHMQHAILASWFDPNSEYTLLHHVGTVGLVLNFLLDNGRLYLALAGTMLLASIIAMPILEYMANRFLVSSFFWSTWPSWARFVHAALPLKLFLGQLALKGISIIFLKIARIVRAKLINLECRILEDRIPITVGAGSEVEGDDEGDDEDDDDDDADNDDAIGNENESEAESEQEYDDDDDDESLDDYFDTSSQ